MMKNKNWLIIILVVIGTFGFILKPNNKENLPNNSYIPSKPKKQFAIYVEKTKGQKDWEEVTEFPGKGYKLGSDTKCEDNSGNVIADAAVMNSDGSVTVSTTGTTFVHCILKLKE